MSTQQKNQNRFINKHKLIVGVVFCILSLIILAYSLYLYINRPQIYNDSNTKIMSGHLSQIESKYGGTQIELQYKEGERFKINFAKSKKFNIKLFEECYYNDMIVTCVVDSNDNTKVPQVLALYDIRYMQDKDNNHIYLKLEDVNYSNSHFNRYITGTGIIFFLPGLYLILSAIFKKETA